MVSGIPFSQEQMDGIKQKIVMQMAEGPDVPFYIACQNAGVGLSTAHAWRNIDKQWDDDIKAARAISLENGLDRAEHVLGQNIEAGKEASVFFYLKSKGKQRGFVDRQEVAGVPDQPLIHHHVKYDTPEEAAAAYKAVIEI